MDYNKYIEEFKQIPHIISVGIVKLSPNLLFYQFPKNSSDFKNLLVDFLQIISQKLMDLSLTHFIFKDSSKMLIGYFEQDTLLLLNTENDIKLETLKIKIDEFLNALLID
jgi:hypothetical protein